MGLGVGADLSGFDTCTAFDGGPDWVHEGGAFHHYLYDRVSWSGRSGNGTRCVRRGWTPCPTTPCLPSGSSGGYIAAENAVNVRV